MKSGIEPEPDNSPAETTRYAPASHEYGNLTSYYVDVARAQNGGANPPRAHTARMGKELAAAIKEKQHPVLLRAAIERMVKNGVSPTSFAEILWQVQCDLKGEAPDDFQLLRDFLRDLREERGLRWPTGSRWTRGSHGGTFVADPLGFDKPTYPVPFSPPTRTELITALKEKEHASHSRSRNLRSARTEGSLAGAADDGEQGSDDPSAPSARPLPDQHAARS